MTREEIIQGLQFTIDMFLSDPLTGEPITKPRNDMDKTTIDACKGAIELLMQEPCEDCISREDAITKVAIFYTNCERLNMFRHTPNEVKQTVADILSDLPPTQPKPKTGHWINKKPRWIPSLSMTIHDAYECSNCGEPGVHWWKHCINCGARMIELQESENA